MAICIEKALQDAALLLAEYQSPSARIDACALLCYVLDKPNSYLYTWPEKLLSVEDLFAFDSLLQRRIQGEPIAYILEEKSYESYS